DVRDAEHLLGGDFDEVGVGLLDLVEPALDAAHLFDVFDGALFAGGDDQALRACFQRNLGLGRALIIQRNQVGLDVDEGAQALVLAEIAARGLFPRGLVLDVGAGVETDEAADAAVIPEASGFECGADGPGFATMLVHNHVGRRVLALEARFDEIHLRFHGGQVVLRAALQQEARADGGEIGNLRNVQPDVLGQHVAEARHDLFGLPALPLEVHNVALHEHGAAVAKTGEAFGAESDIGILFHLDVEALRGGLQEVAVARRTLRVQLEILHAAVLEDDDFDILAAHVADDVHAFIEVEARLGVGHGFHQRRIGAHDVLQNVLGIAGSADAENLQFRAGIADLAVELLQHLDRVFDGVALGELIGLGKDAPLVILGHEHGLGGGGAANDADETFNHFALVEGFGNEFPGAVLFLECGEVCLVLGKSHAAAAFGLFLLAAHVDVPLELAEADVLADGIVLALAELDAADGGEILRVIGGLDQVLGRNAFGERSAALFPDFGNVGFPAIAHALDVAVGAAQQKHHRQQCIAARQHAQVLHHNGFEERRHQLVGRDAHFLQTVDVGLGEDAALAGHGMQFDALIAHLAKLLGGNAQFGVDLVDDGAGAAGTLVVHRRHFLFAAGFRVGLEDDDLGVLAAQFDDAATLGVELFHGQRYRVDFLHELAAEVFGESVAPGTG